MTAARWRRGCAPTAAAQTPDKSAVSEWRASFHALLWWHLRRNWVSEYSIGGAMIGIYTRRSRPSAVGLIQQGAACGVLHGQHDCRYILQHFGERVAPHVAMSPNLSVAVSLFCCAYLSPPICRPVFQSLAHSVSVCLPLSLSLCLSPAPAAAEP